MKKLLIAALVIALITTARSGASAWAVAITWACAAVAAICTLRVEVARRG